MVDESYRYDGPFLSEYERTKWVAHYQVAEPMIEAGLPLVVVLPGAVYGPGDSSAIGRNLKNYLRGRLPVLPVGNVVCWTHVDDVARGHILAMERGVPGESYILAGSPHSVEEVLSLAEEITGVKGPRWYLSPPLTRLLAGIVGVVERVVPVPQDYSAENLRTLAGVTYLASNQKAQRELGYTLRPLELGLRETLTYMMGELGMSPAQASAGPTLSPSPLTGPDTSPGVGGVQSPPSPAPMPEPDTSPGAADVRPSPSLIRGYLLAGLLGFAAGALLMALVTRAVPRLMAAMMENMAACMGEDGPAPPDI
jgi:hypothetical protein